MTIEESALNVWHYLNQSVSCVELDEFNYVELIYYKVGQSLSKTGARITKCNNLTTKWGKHNYKVGQLRVITKGQGKLKSGAVNSLQSGAIISTKRDMYYKKRRFIAKWGRYYKLGQELLQSGAGNFLQGG